MLPIILQYITLHYVAVVGAAQGRGASCYMTVHYITLHYTALHCVALHHISLHYITLQVLDERKTAAKGWFGLF